jgi:hypothetical protein
MNIIEQRRDRFIAGSVIVVGIALAAAFVFLG